MSEADNAGGKIDNSPLVLADATSVAEIEAWLDAHREKGLLRFLTCGSVDDGKSTLIGRMLYEANLIHDDHLAAAAADSKRVGTQGEDLDLALLLDGLEAEREQGITIDVAYRFFSTENRKFIVADTPGHEQYTRNMVTGASNADLAVILIDARKGVLTQTRRHSFLVSLLGIRHVVIAINKMDLVEFKESVFTKIVDDYSAFAQTLNFATVTPIPMSALRGDNVLTRSEQTPWFRGPSLFQHLESIDLQANVDDHSAPFRMPVQWVNRPDLDFRGFAGTVVGGRIAPGDPVEVAPGGQRSTVARIVTMDGDLSVALPGQSVTITLADEIDVSRGDLLVTPGSGARISDHVDAHVVWMHEQPMQPGRRYLVKLGTRTVGALFEQPRYRINVNTLVHESSLRLELNEIGRCGVRFDRRVAVDLYSDQRTTGSFIVIDPITEATVGAGMILDVAARADDVHWHGGQIDGAARARLNGHRPAIVWMTGLSGSGKSTVAAAAEALLHARGVRTFVLDGDNVRHGLNRDLGFDDAARAENVRRVAEVAGLMAEAGIVVICALISPFAEDRAQARRIAGDTSFFEVHVATPIEVAEARDPKGLYRRARAGEIRGFTGIDAPYEAPLSPELVLDTSAIDVPSGAARIVALLEDADVLDAG